MSNVEFLKMFILLVLVTNNGVRNISQAVLRHQYSLRLLYCPKPTGVHCGLSTASEVFLNFTTQLY